MSEQSQGPGWWLASDGRWYPPESHPTYRHVPPEERRRRWFIGVGLALLFAATLVVAVLNDDDHSSDRIAFDDVALESGWALDDLVVPDRLPEATAVAPLPQATLTVHDDGCGVIRSELPGDPHGLTWSVSDEDGFQVLQRNAVGETHYRYFRPGAYTVVLEAWGGETYVPISNEVTITC